MLEILFYIWLAGMMFYSMSLFVRLSGTKQTYNTTGVIFFVCAAFLGLIWPVYVPLVVFRAINRKAVASV